MIHEQTIFTSDKVPGERFDTLQQAEAAEFRADLIGYLTSATNVADCDVIDIVDNLLFKYDITPKE